MSSALVVGLAVLIGVTASGASDQTAATPSSAPAPAIEGAVDSAKNQPLFTPKAKARFEKLKFQPHRDLSRAVPQERVVCGMRILPADPSIDPKMILHSPKDGTDLKIKRWVPPVCTE